MNYGRDRPTLNSRLSARHAWAYFTRWAVWPLLTIAVASFMIFIMLSFTPGDPVITILGEKSTPEQRDLLRAELGLSKPIVLQYIDWAINAVKGNLGFSYTYRDSVVQVILPRLATTFSLLIYSAVLIFCVGIALGLIGGLSKRARPIISGIVGLLLSIPSYLAATFLLGIFSITLGWFPTFGSGGPDPIDRIWHLTLPAIALSIPWAAYIAQISSAAISEQRSSEFVRTAIGRGLPWSIVVPRHVLRNAGIPVLTAAGLTVASLVAGSIIVETAFTVDGLGSLLVKSVLTKDTPVVSAISVIIVATFVFVMTLVDALHTLVDPEMRKR